MFSMPLDKLLAPGDLISTEPTTLLKPDGIEPELGRVILPLNMNMGRLMAITCVKEESVGASSQYSGHWAVRCLP
jgi:hypothetical protein